MVVALEWGCWDSIKKVSCTFKPIDALPEENDASTTLNAIMYNQIKTFNYQQTPKVELK